MVSALIVSYNVRASLLDALRALYSSNGTALEAVVVDNASSDGSADALEAAFPQVKVIRMDENVGFGRANNAGLEKCDGRFNRYNLGHLPADSVHEIDAGTAACLIVRRAAIDQVGFFDPEYFMYGEDLDLCYRLRKGGWKIFYVPDAIALHVKGSSTRQASTRMRYEFHRAMWVFHRKHYASSTPALGNGMVWVGIWARWAAISLRAWITRDARVSP